MENLHGNMHVLVLSCLSCPHNNVKESCVILVSDMCHLVLITPRRVGGGRVKQLVLSVRPSVRPSVRLSGVCPLKNRAISRFTGLSDC